MMFEQLFDRFDLRGVWGDDTDILRFRTHLQEFEGKIDTESRFGFIVVAGGALVLRLFCVGLVHIHKSKW